MAILIQITCLMLVLGMVSSWPFPLIFERRIPITYVHTVEEGSVSPPSSLFNNLNRMMASMHQRLEHMFDWPSYSMDVRDNDYDYDYTNDEEKLNHADQLTNIEQPIQVVDDLVDIKKKLDAVEPVCTTVTDAPSTISPRKSRRKKLPGTQTITCIKELILNGQKHFSEEINTTDDKGVVIKHSESYGAISADTYPNQE